jgi:hypothetical protein
MLKLPRSCQFFERSFTNTALTAQPGQQGAHQEIEVEGIGLGPPVTARHRDRGGIDDLALDPSRFQQTVDPEAVPASLLDHHEPQRPAQLVFSLVLDPRQ